MTLLVPCIFPCAVLAVLGRVGVLDTHLQRKCIFRKGQGVEVMIKPPHSSQRVGGAVGEKEGGCPSKKSQSVSGLDLKVFCNQFYWSSIGLWRKHDV